MWKWGLGVGLPSVIVKPQVCAARYDPDPARQLLPECSRAKLPEGAGRSSALPFRPVVIVSLEFGCLPVCLVSSGLIGCHSDDSEGRTDDHKEGGRTKL